MSLIAVASLGASDPSEQGAQEQAPVFRGGTALAEVDVSVLDRNRRPVSGLTSSNFAVREDGVLQPVMALSEVVAPEGRTEPVWAPSTPRDVNSNDAANRRLFAIVIDGLADPLSPRTPWSWGRPLDPRVVDGVSAMARGVVARVSSQDLVALIGGGCFQPFTADLAQMDTAISSLRSGGDGCPQRIRPIAVTAPRLLIRDVTEYLSAIPEGRKTLIYIGPGPVLDTRGSERPVIDVTETVEIARRANVNIYALSPRMIAADDLSNIESLRALTDDTGGVAFADPHEYQVHLDRIFQENRSHYLLGYRSTHPSADGKIHRVSVEVPGRQVIVRAPSMVQRADAAANGKAASVLSRRLPASVDGLLPNLDITFDAQALPFAVPGRAAAGVIVITRLSERVPFGIGRVAQRMQLRVIAYGEMGAVRASTEQSAVLDDVAAADGALRYRVLSHLTLVPGRYQLRLVAHNGETGKLGTMEFAVQIPDFQQQKVALSGVALTRAGQTSEPTFGTLPSWLPAMPTVERTFAASARLDAVAHVYQNGTAPVAPVQVRAELFDAQGTRLLATDQQIPTDRFGTSREAPYGFSLPLAPLRLASGEYLLTFQGRLGSRRSPRRDIRFTIR